MTDSEFKLSIPSELFDEIKIESKKVGMSKLDYLKMVIKLGLTCMKIIVDPKSKLLVEEDGKTREVVL